MQKYVFLFGVGWEAGKGWWNEAIPVCSDLEIRIIRRPVFSCLNLFSTVIVKCANTYGISFWMRSIFWVALCWWPSLTVSIDKRPFHIWAIIFFETLFGHGLSGWQPLKNLTRRHNREDCGSSSLWYISLLKEESQNRAHEKRHIA